MGEALTFHPVTRARWPDFEALFGGRGGPKACWCMVWRSTTEESRAPKGPARKRYMHSRIECGATVGLLGYDGGKPVAWVSIAPKNTYRRLGGPEPEAGENVWSLACMFALRTHRGKGVGHQLIDAAVAEAKKRGATSVEAYPVDPESPSYRFMGFVPAFEKAGFKEIGTAGARRHVMRLEL